MIALWPHWQRPFFIILLPLFIYLVWKLWRSHQVKGSWQEIIPTFFQPWLLKGSSIKESILPKLLLSLAGLFALLALLGPSWKHIEQPLLKLDAPLVIVIDMTPRMLSSDIPPSRLQSVKRKLIDIINARKDTQTALIAYAGSAHVVVPLSDDKATLDNLINSLSPSIMPKQGENAAAGIAKAIQLIDNTKENSETTQAKILLITAGLDQQEQESIKKLLLGKSLSLDILGVGTEQGAPILMNGHFLKDNTGKIITPKLDNASLQSLAYSEGGYYSPITLNDSDIEALHLSNPMGDKRYTDEADLKKTTLWQDQGYWFLVPLLFIAAFAGRKGWLYCLPLIVITLQPNPVQAFEWSSLWLNKNQQAQKLLKENNPVKAEKLFQDKQWQGYAAYQAKNYEKAEKIFANAQTPEGIYNYGNTLARQGKYKEAIAQWDKAIKEKPNFEQAIVNKKIVEELLKQQQQQEQEQQGKGQKQHQEDYQLENVQQLENIQQQQSLQLQGQASENKSQKEQQQSNKEQTNKQNSDSLQQNTQQLQEMDEGGSDTIEQSAEQQVAKLQELQKLQKLERLEKLQKLQELQESRQEDQQQEGKKQFSDLENVKPVDRMYIQKQEQEESLKQILDNVPDDPSELLRRKFYYEQRYNKGNY